jgi:phospholipid/cholesterol/gamma-HCH transport system ATP-binding protein
MDPLLIVYDEPFAGLDPISLNVIANLIRKLNDALGATSIVVTYDVSESLKVVDQAFFLSEGVVAGHGRAGELARSGNPFVHQFVHAEPDGPVAFHYPGAPLGTDFGVGPAAAG